MASKKMKGARAGLRVGAKVAPRAGRTAGKLAWKAGKSIPLEVVCSIVADAALGLDHAHRMQLIHRDVSPENLMMNSEGVTKVLDFGIARSSTNPSLTQTGELTVQEAEQRAAAGGADLLVVPAAGELVTEAEVPLDGREIGDERRRRERPLAAAAARLLRARAGVLVEADAQLGRALEERGIEGRVHVDRLNRPGLKWIRLTVEQRAHRVRHENASLGPQVRVEDGVSSNFAFVASILEGDAVHTS